MDLSQLPINEVPAWVQWAGIIASILGCCLSILTVLKNFKKPFLVNLVRLCSFIFFTIGALFSFWIAFNLDGQSKWGIVRSTILGTLFFIAAVLSLLSLFSGLIPRIMLFIAKKSSPIGKCTTHVKKILQTYDSFDLLISRNKDSAWLLPPPSPDVVSDIDHSLDYLELEFREWSWLVTGSQGHTGLLEETQYLFITWNWSHPPNDTDRSLIEKLGPMLKQVGEYTSRNSLITHRVLLGPWLSMKSDQWKKFYEIIWEPYFKPFCDSTKTNYRIRFIDINAFLREYNSKDHSKLQYFKDVALFSFDSNVQQIVRNDEQIILPFPEEKHNTQLAEYAALQYSELLDGFLALQAVHGTSASGRGTRRGDRIIEERRKIVKKYWEMLSKLKNINSDVKKISGIEFYDL